MKKLLLIIFASFSLSCFSQASKFKVHQFAVDRVDDNKEMEWKKSKDILVSITSSRITVYTSTERNYDLIGTPVEEYDKENDADVLFFNAVDRDGVKCECALTKYRNNDDITVAVLLVMYEKYVYGYRLKAVY